MSLPSQEEEQADFEVDPAIVAMAKEKFPNAILEAQKIDGELFIIRSPTRPEWNRAVQKSRRNEDDQAFETLGYACTVYPEPAQLNTIFEQRPAMLQALASAVTQLGGMAKKVEKKRL